MPFSNLLNPLLGAGNYRIEQKEEDKRLSLILMVDEAKQPTAEKLEEIKQLLRTASGFLPARGDILRVIVTPFNRYTTLFWVLLSAITFALGLVVYYFYRRLHPTNEPQAFHKPPPQIKTLDDYVQERQQVAAAVFRHWLKNEPKNG